MTFLLRVEAVNLINFVYDTNKIQPTRGGSFLLLESVQKLVEEDSKTKSLPIFGGVTLEKITTGASIGLYRFKADSDTDPQKVADEVLKTLNNTMSGHATFVVDFLEETGNFKKDLLLLHTRNRWRQYQQPTLVLPEINSNATKECGFDGVRPIRPGNEEFNNELVSSSVAFRAKAGKDLRQNIYKRILKRDDLNFIFTDDLQRLSESKELGNLNGKIAFIYFDGNKFTKIRAQLCDTIDKLKIFSEVVEKSRANFLNGLLNKASFSNDFKIGGEIRLETLLWGGDELEIVVPAWKGWEVIRDFYKAMKGIDYDGAQLTHAGGIVFCNHKAPIREIRRMAHELAEMVKDNIQAEFVGFPKEITRVNHDKHDAFYFLTLESFDTVGGKVKPFVQTYYGKTVWQAMQMNAGRMEKLEAAITTMKTEDFPRNKIFDIIHRIDTRKEEKEKTYKDFENFIGKILDGFNKEKRDVITNALNTFIEGQIERWFVICDLWDYVGGVE